MPVIGANLSDGPDNIFYGILVQVSKTWVRALPDDDEVCRIGESFLLYERRGKGRRRLTRPGSSADSHIWCTDCKQDMMDVIATRTWQNTNILSGQRGKTLIDILSVSERS
eukprot:752570-Hanusia_phi.AAC.7